MDVEQPRVGSICSGRPRHATTALDAGASQPPCGRSSPGEPRREAGAVASWLPQWACGEAQPGSCWIQRGISHQEELRSVASKPSVLLPTPCAPVKATRIATAGLAHPLSILSWMDEGFEVDDNNVLVGRCCQDWLPVAPHRCPLGGQGQSTAVFVPGGTASQSLATITLPPVSTSRRAFRVTSKPLSEKR